MQCVHMVCVVNLSHHYPMCIRKGKIIVLSVSCRRRRCQHEIGLIWTFRHFGMLKCRLTIENGEKQAQLGQESNVSGYKSYNHCFCLPHLSATPTVD